MRLREAGIKALLEPMLDLVPLPHAPIDFKDVQGVLLTSRGAAHALAAATSSSNLALYYQLRQRQVIFESQRKAFLRIRGCGRLRWRLR